MIARQTDTVDARAKRLCQGPLSSAQGRSWNLPGDGHEICPVVAMGSARGLAATGLGFRPGASPLVRRGLGTSRTESPLVWQTWAWCSSRSTVAVASAGHQLAERCRVQVGADP